MLAWKNIFAYDKHNKITHEASYDPDGSLVWEDKYKYDKNDHLLEKFSNVIEDKKTGEYRLPHHVDLKSGFYNGKKVLDK